MVAEITALLQSIRAVLDTVRWASCRPFDSSTLPLSPSCLRHTSMISPTYDVYHDQLDLDIKPGARKWRTMSLVPLVLTATFHVVLAVAVHAGTSYTPAQLKQMIESGKYPDQGPVSDTQTKQMSFAACLIAVEQIVSQIRENYPVFTLVDSSLVKIVKIWTNNGAVTATCSSLDNKMILTQAPYK